MLGNRNKELRKNINRITINLLLDDERKHKYLFSGFFYNILNNNYDPIADEIKQMIFYRMQEMCSKYGDTSSWGYLHQHNYGYLTGYGNQQISSHHPAFVDYTGSGHQPYTGHHEGDMGIQGDSGYHGEEDMDTKEEGRFDD
uniref:Uncharacterized protein n=1 Tax=Meloidogyne javanica TaxID=6303 RepID=A0A915N785_MELJA